VRGATCCGTPLMSLTPWSHKGFLVPSADGLDGVRGCANIGEHVHVLLDAVAHALECGSEEIPSGVRQAEAENHSLGPADR